MKFGQQEFRGIRGRARRIPIDDPTIPGYDTTVAWWLLEGPWHPFWHQYILGVVHLRDVPGAPPAKLQFPGATHELFVVALDPGEPPSTSQYSFEHIKAGKPTRKLEPYDVVHQFEATDQEMDQVAELCAHACVDGSLTPSTDDARAFYREAWLAAIVRSLAHSRGEEHHGWTPPSEPS